MYKKIIIALLVLVTVAFFVTYEGDPSERISVTTNRGDPPENNFLLEAATKGKIFLIETALIYHADINTKNANGETPLALAKKHKHKKAVAYILKHGGKM